jgi:hypothetical protein
MMRFLAAAAARFGAALRRRVGLAGRATVRGTWHVTCCRPDGTIRWVESYSNLITNEGLDYCLDVALSGGSQQSNWYVGLLGSSPSPAAGWTKTEVGAADFVDYDEATLPAWTDGGVSSQSVDNSASKASFTISTNSSTIGGAYLASANTKAVEGGAATIYAAGAFTGGDKSADDGDTLEVTATFTTADDGA